MTQFYKLPEQYTSSLDSVFAACPEKFQKSYVERLYGRENSIHLIAGGAFAAALAAGRMAFYEQGLSQEAADRAAFLAMIAKWEGDSIFSGHKKGLASMWNCYEAYVARFPFATDALQPWVFGEGRRGIEFNFAVPLPINHPDTGAPLLYSGRGDMIANWEGKMIITDEKTTGQIGPSWSGKFTMRGQFIGYTWAAQQYSLPVMGVFVRGIAPRSSGDVEIIQAPFIYTPLMIERWYQSMLQRVERMVWAYQHRTFERVFGDPCADFGGCGYQSLCMSAHPDTTNFVVREKLYFEP